MTKDQLIEVEVKVRIEEDDLPQILKKLGDLNAIFIEKVQQSDLYFNSPERDFAVTDEALRLREIIEEHENEKKEDNYILSWKGPKFFEKDIDKTREEIKIKIKDFDKTKKIFEKLGFTPVETVVKERKIYKLGDIELTIDLVRGIDGHFIELETSAFSIEEVEKKKQELLELLYKINVDVRRCERRAYLDILLNKKRK